MMTGRERLLRGREIMEGLTADKLDMANWYQVVTAPTKCGTAACFLGWCARDKILQAEGLVPAKYQPEFGEACGEVAAQEFFDISERAATMLVIPTHYDYSERITPEQVIARIDEVLAGEYDDEEDEWEEEDEDEVTSEDDEEIGFGT